MVSDCENWRRCHINSKKINYRLFLGGLLGSLFLSFVFLLYLDHSINKLLSSYIDAEVERVTSVVVHKALESVNQNRLEYFTIKKDDDQVSRIRYNTYEINQFNDLLVQEIQKEYRKMEQGNFDFDHYAIQERLREKYPYLQNGYLCEVSFNSLRGSTMFANLGPMIPIKLSFMGYVTSDVDIQVKEYGVNNAIVEVYSIVNVSNLISMPISSKTYKSTIKNVLSFEIIPGEVPQYYAGTLR
ncbi:MAG: sporulation protein YunB [Bacilli bacterium]|nr:sporulation protein YunB [Bacilli bacterium]